MDDKNLNGCKKMNLDTVKQPHGTKDQKPTEDKTNKQEDAIEGELASPEQMATKIVIV